MQALTSLCYVIIVKMSIGSDSFSNDASEINSKSELDESENDRIIEKQKQGMSSYQYLNGPVERRHSRPISIPVTHEKNDDLVCCLSAEYDLATWNMYNRIMDHRTRMAREEMTSRTLAKNEPSTSSSKRLSRSKVKNTEKLNPSEKCPHKPGDCKDCCSSEAEEHDCLQFQLDED